MWRGKTIVLAHNSPSHYFVLNALHQRRALQRRKSTSSSRRMRSSPRPRSNADKRARRRRELAADIYNLEKVKATRSSVTTRQPTNSSPMLVRAAPDFANDNPDIMEGLTRAIFDHDDRSEGAGCQAERLPSCWRPGYSILEATRSGMAGRRALDHYAEKPRLFPQPEQPDELRSAPGPTRTSFIRRVNAVTEQTPFDQGWTSPSSRKLGAEQKYGQPEDEYDVISRRRLPAFGAGRKGRDSHQDRRYPLLPNSWTSTRSPADTDRQGSEELYDRM